MRRPIHLCLVGFVALSPASAYGAAPQRATQDSPIAVTGAAVASALERGVAYFAAQVTPTEAAPTPLIRRGTRAGLRALILYTLLKCGTGQEFERIAADQLMRDLALEDVHNTYDAACLLLALQAYGVGRERDWLEDLTRELIATQNAGGAWGYPSNPGDLSNTQYAALGLWAAVRAGVEVPAEVWRRLGDSLVRVQGDDGGFPYAAAKAEDASTDTMTSAGVGTLALCEVQLARLGELSVRQSLEFASARARGLDWFETGGRWSPGATQVRGHYLLYGIERMAAFADLEQVGGVDWYRMGASQLLNSQRPDGSWGAHSETCFALLFLRRASRLAAVSGPKSAPSHGSTQASGRDSPVHLVADGEAPLRVWLHAWHPPALAQYEWPDEAGRGPHVYRVLYFVDGAPAAIAFGDARRPGARARYEKAIELPSTGAHHVQARIELALPPERKGEPLQVKTISTPSLRVEVAHAKGAPLQPLSSAPGESAATTRGRSGKSSVKASSVEQRLRGFDGEAFAAERALDGRRRSPWLAQEDDRDPMWSVRFNGPQRATRLRLWHAALVGAERDLLARPVEVEVLVDQGRVFRGTLTFPADENAPLEIELEGAPRVQRIEVRILSSEPRLGVRSIGLGEVELVDDAD